MTIGYVPPVPAFGVPARVAVPLPLSVSVTPAGSAPVSLRATLTGKPVVVTENVPAAPTVKVVLAPLVIAGAWFTTSVKFCVAFGATPLLPVMVTGWRPPVPAFGVPARVAVPLPLSVNVTFAGSVPVFDSTTLTGKPVVVTANVPAAPVWKVVVFALV